MKISILSVLLSCTFLTGSAIAQQSITEPADYLRIHEEIAAEITQAEADLANFGEGILRNMILLRIETLRLNQAIVQGRLLGGEVDAPAPLPSVMPDPELASRILAEMDALEVQIEATERQVAATTGAIVALPMTRLETDKVSLAMLRASWLRAEYGVVAPIFNDMQLPGPQAVGTADTAVLPRPLAEVADPAQEANTAFSDPAYPRVDYTRPIFRDRLPEGASFTGWWMHSQVADGAGYMMANASLLMTEDGMSDPMLSAYCGSGWSKLVLRTGKVLRSGGQDQLEVTMTPDWLLPHTALWELEREPDGDSLSFSGTRNIIYMSDAQDISFSFRDAEGELTEIRFQTDGVSKVLESMFADGGCTLDDVVWSAEENGLVQTRLNNLGYDVGAPDGSFGVRSKEALRRWQNDNGLPATGEFDFRTLKGLGFHTKPGKLDALKVFLWGN